MTFMSSSIMSNKGGKREGAGRPPSTRPVTVKVPRSTYIAILSLRKDGETIGQVVARAIEALATKKN